MFSNPFKLIRDVDDHIRQLMGLYFYHNPKNNEEEEAQFLLLCNGSYILN